MTTGVGATSPTPRRGQTKPATANNPSDQSKGSTEDGLGASVGQNVRAERKRQGISVRQLAKRLGVSASFISQFELGQSKAAVNTLFAIATELNLSLDELLGSTVNTNHSNGAASARPRRLTDTGNQTAFGEYLQLQSGVRWKRLADTSPDHHVQFLITEYDPGSDSAPGDAPQRHPGNDYGYVLEGTLTIEIDGRRRNLTAGEAIHMRGDIPHRLRNLSDKMVRAVWFVVT